MTDLVMPKFGLTMTEGLLSEWHVPPGARFSAGDMLFTVETEKVANEVEAEVDGVLSAILVPAGETVPVGTPVARLEGSDTIAGPGGPPPVAAPSGTSVSVTGPLDSPSARKMMAEHGLDRDAVDATGRDGRVMKEDVLRVIATPLARRIASAKNVDLSEIAGSGPRGRIKARDVDAAKQAALVTKQAAPAQPGVTEITPDAIRRATAQRVSTAKREIPHFHLTHEAEITALDALRQSLNADAGAATPRISITHMLIRALGLALAEAPEMNRIWVGERIFAFDQVDVGMVAETPDGVRIPVLRDVGNITLDDVAARARALADRARTGQLSPSDVGDGVISISNVGMFGVSSLTPIINPPNAMILGVGADRRVFRPDPDGAPALRRELTLTLACDHRIIDGAAAARFLSAVVGNLETPLRLLRPARTA